MVRLIKLVWHMRVVNTIPRSLAKPARARRAPSRAQQSVHTESSGVGYFRWQLAHPALPLKPHLGNASSFCGNSANLSD